MAASGFILPAFVDQEFIIRPKPILKTGQCADLLKRVINTNQYGISQRTFRATSVLHL